MELHEELEYTQHIKRLEDTKSAMQLYRLPRHFRACIAQLLITSTIEGSIPGRSKTGLYIAVEMRRCDLPEDKIKKTLDHCNQNNQPPMAEKEIRGILKQSDKRDTKGAFKYSPGCNRHLADYCIGKDTCTYYRENFKGRRSKEPNYNSLGWQHVLNAREYLTLKALKDIEVTRRLSKGSPIVITLRQLTWYTGINFRRFKDILIKLKAYSLISYEPGSPQLWKGKATEIKRSIPAPEIPRRYREREAWVEFREEVKAKIAREKAKNKGMSKGGQ